MSKLMNNYSSNTGVYSHSAGHKHFSQILTPAWSVFTDTLGGMLALRQQIGVVVRVKFLVHSSQRHLAQQHQASVVLSRSKTVVGRLSHHISKIDPLAEHVTGYRSFRRSDPQSLAEDTHEIG
jgi:hypothetical protein